MKRNLTGVIALLAALAFTAGAANPPYYVKMAGWQETLRCSREALLEWEKANPVKESEFTFGPWYILAPVDCGTKGFDWKADFETEKIDVAKEYENLGSWKPAQNQRDGEVVELPPNRNNVTTYLFRNITLGTPRSIRVYLGSDDGIVVYLNGKCLLTNNCARGPAPNQETLDLNLEAGENQLLLKIHNISGGHGYYFSASGEAGGASSPELLRRLELRRLVEREFSSDRAAREMRFEHEAGIWNQDWNPGDFGELARRYANAVEQERMKKEINDVAASAKDPESLSKARQIFHRYNEMMETLASIGEFRPEPLRLAIEHLTKTFPEQYPKGPEYLLDLDAIWKDYDTAVGTGDVEKISTLGKALIALRSKALLSNPLLDFDSLLFVKRDLRGPSLGLPQNWQGNCALPRGGYNDEICTIQPVRPGGSVKTLFKPERETFVGDVDLHFDGDKMLFSTYDGNNRWAVAEIKSDGSGYRTVSPTDEPDVDWYDPCYLPDDRILMAGTACFHGVPCVGGGNTVANLFLLDVKDKSMRQLTFDQDHNWSPAILNNGRVIYSRWEYSDSPHYFTRLLFHMNPDGTAQMEYYGSNSYWPNSIFYARPIPNHPTKVVAIISGHHGVPRMGEMIIFDPASGRKEADGVVQRIPGYKKTVPPTIADGLVDQVWPKFLHPYPLSEEYFLVSCQPKPGSLWGIYLVDVFDNALCLAETPGYALFEPLPSRTTPRPPVIPDKVRLDQKDAVVYLSDVYFGRGLAGVPKGTIKKLRIYEYHYAYPQMGGHINIGIDGPWDVHRIVGTVPVDEDGSAVFHVPANTPLAVQPLDSEGKAVQLMRSWFTAMPGEVLSCVGCHEPQNSAPPSAATVASISSPSEIEPWYGPTRGFSFVREVQPVLDEYCIGCHDGKTQQDGKQIPNFAKIDRGWGNFNESYISLHPYVRRPGPESDYHIQKPYEWHADTSELVQMLKKGHHGVELDAEAWDRIITWIDLNVPDHGTWGEHREIAGNLHQRRLEARTKYAGRPEDPEEYPSAPPERRTFLKPKETSVKSVEKPAAEGWPFNADEAKKRRETSGASPELPIRLADKINVDLVLIPAGKFIMGDAGGFEDELPLTAVNIDKTFYMSKFEITNAQYALFDPDHESGYISVYNKDQDSRGIPADQADQPVIRVTWVEAMNFCRWLSEKTGRTFSLPTEAQWEYACRAGTETSAYYGDAGADFGKFGNLADESVNVLARRDSPKWIPSIPSTNDGSVVTNQVGRYAPNALGLYDMHGNVCEWTLSTYRPYPYNPTDGRDAGNPGDYKVVRGGSFYDRPTRARSAFRLAYPGLRQVYNVGFRVVCPVEPDSVKGNLTENAKTASLQGLAREMSAGR